jgi:acyl-CoA thioesterase FadM
MREHVVQVKVEPAHIDAGNHVNWLAQLQIAQAAHFALREQLGLGLEPLKTRHGLFLVMGRIHDVAYHRQMRLGEVIDVRIRIWPSRSTCLELSAELVCGGRLAATMSWTMPLISMATGRLCRIPAWMLEAVGAGESEAPTSSPGTPPVALPVARAA